MVVVGLLWLMAKSAAHDNQTTIFYNYGNMVVVGVVLKIDMTTAVVAVVAVVIPLVVVLLVGVAVVVAMQESSIL